MYWVVRADFEGKLKRKRFKFLISFIKFKSFAARTFRTTQYNIIIFLCEKDKEICVYFYQHNNGFVK